MSLREWTDRTYLCIGEWQIVWTCEVNGDCARTCRWGVDGADVTICKVKG